MDKISKTDRSRVMSRVRSRDTRPELALRKALRLLGSRGYRIAPKLPGRPDIAFPKAKVAVFVDGCFWHHCPVCFRAPQSNQAYWEPKIRSNVARDLRASQDLLRLGWLPLRIWEHEIRQDPLACARRIADAIEARLLH